MRLQAGLAGVAFALCRISARAETVAAAPATLPPLAPLQDCAQCRDLIVVPMGMFIMGSPPGESRLNNRWDDGNIRLLTADDPYIPIQGRAASHGHYRLVHRDGPA